MWEILTVTILAVFIQGMNTGELGDMVKGPPVVPLSLPVSYRVLNTESLFVKDSSQEPLRNSSLLTHSQAFVLLHTSRPPTVNASYGPLSAESPISPELVQEPSIGLGLSRRVRSFILARRILSTAPKVRVLFYVSGRRDREGEVEGGRLEEKEEMEQSCVMMFGFLDAQEAGGSCLLREDVGFCMAELQPAGAWFRPASGPSSRERQEQKEAGAGAMELYYRTQPVNKQGGCTPNDGPGGLVTPMRRIGSVRLLQVPAGTGSFTRLRLGGGVLVQTSSKPVRQTNMATFFVSVSSASPLARFTLRATVKKGLSFNTARPSNSHVWDTALEPGTGDQLGTIAIVCQRRTPIAGKRPEGGLLELLQLDFEIEEPSNQPEVQVITWRLELPGGQRRGDQGIMRIYTTPKDYVGLAPLVTDTELLNTAVLTGKKVSMALRTVAVGADGLITDVSNLTQCGSTDEEVLKVSDRCDYVFVNGKETKGRVRVAVNFTYGHLSAQLEMTVWMPRLPLQIEVSDPELSQVKGWRVPVPAGKRSSWESEEDEDRKGKGCMLQYQHALVKVFTQFLADQLDPQLPPAYFLGADWQVDVTKLVRSSLKVENTRVARLQAGRVLLGRGIGVTTVKVLSPLSDSVLGERTVKVLDDKVSITELGVQLVSGLSLSLQLSPGSNRAIVAMATMQEVLQNPKQEAVVGCWVQFSDGSVMPLDVYDSSSYMLTVTSLDKAVASVRGSPPRVMAERQGQGSLVRVEMGISEACQKSKRKSSLAVGHGDLRVTFQPSGLLFSGGGNGQEPVTEARTQRPLIRGSPTEREGHLLVSSVSQASSWRFRTTTTSPVPNMVSVSTVRDREADRELTSTNKASSSTSESSTTIGGPRSSTGGRASSILGGVSSTTSRASSNVGGASSNVGGVRHGWGGVISNMGGASNSLGVVSSSLGGVSSPVYDGGMVSIAAAGANTLDYSNVPSQVEVPKWSTPVEVESDMVQTSRFPSNLEIGMYALLGVLCLAILVFLLNCISYLMGTRHKKPPAQCQEPGNHRHNWVWLGTEADRAINGPVTPPQPESHAAIAINIDVAPGMGMVGMGKSATLGRRTSAPPSMDPLLGRRGSLQAKPTRGESLHSPTSKRKRVQFTTFSSLDNPHYSTLPGMHWATKVQNFTERHGAFQESLYANLPYEPKPMQ